MRCQRLLFFLFVLGIYELLERREGHLGVDNNPLAIRQVDDDIGPESATLGVRRTRLAVVLDAFSQACFLEDRLENHLTPGALRLGLALERPGQITGFVHHCLVELA